MLHIYNKKCYDQPITSVERMSRYVGDHRREFALLSKCIDSFTRMRDDAVAKLSTASESEVGPLLEIVKHCDERIRTLSPIAADVADSLDEAEKRLEEMKAEILRN